jgi:copper chaperone
VEEQRRIFTKHCPLFPALHISSFGPIVKKKKVDMWIMEEQRCIFTRHSAPITKHYTLVTKHCSGGKVMAEATIKIEGMSCGHCVMRVKKALETLGGIAEADVNIGAARVKYDESRVKREDLDAAVEAAGYKVSA